MVRTRGFGFAEDTIFKIRVIANPPYRVVWPEHVLITLKAHIHNQCAIFVGWNADTRPISTL